MKGKVNDKDGPEAQKKKGLGQNLDSQQRFLRVKRLNISKGEYGGIQRRAFREMKGDFLSPLDAETIVAEVRWRKDFAANHTRGLGRKITKQ